MCSFLQATPIAIIIRLSHLIYHHFIFNYLGQEPRNKLLSLLVLIPQKYTVFSFHIDLLLPILLSITILQDLLECELHGRKDLLCLLPYSHVCQTILHTLK